MKRKLAGEDGVENGISVIMIVYNEESVIAATLESVLWADEIVVVDSGSTDRTPEICRSFPKVRFIYQPWDGFGKQKNFALKHASNPWVFSLDADESVSPALAAEIRRVINSAACDGYVVKRKNFYGAQWIRHSGWWPDEVLRLFRRNAGRFSDRPVHESVELTGKVGRLENPIEHRSFHSVADFIKKADSYSTLGAELMCQKGYRSSATKAFTHGVYTFFKTYILRLGFLDGRAGLLIAASNAAGVFYRYMKALEMQERES
uniref:Glycosyltransferase family 2 protein n=1 Tax=Geobacter metallireducens TaxID=28232 RepID=A0A831U0J5_GEOME